MNTTAKLTTALAVALGLLQSSQASAITFVSNGNGCHNYDNAEAGDFYYLANGLHHVSTGSPSAIVVCPIIANASPYHGATFTAHIEVTIDSGSSRSISCYAYDYDSTGTYIANSSVATYTNTGGSSSLTVSLSSVSNSASYFGIY